MKVRWTLFIKVQLLIVSILLISYVAVEITIFSFIGSQMQSRFIDGVKNTVILTQKNIETVFTDANRRITYLSENFESKKM